MFDFFRDLSDNVGVRLGPKSKWNVWWQSSSQARQEACAIYVDSILCVVSTVAGDIHFGSE